MSIDFIFIPTKEFNFRALYDSTIFSVFQQNLKSTISFGLLYPKARS